MTDPCASTIGVAVCGGVVVPGPWLFSRVRKLPERCPPPAVLCAAHLGRQLRRCQTPVETNTLSVGLLLVQHPGGSARQGLQRPQGPQRRQKGGEHDVTNMLPAALQTRRLILNLSDHHHCKQQRYPAADEHGTVEPLAWECECP